MCVCVLLNNVIGYLKKALVAHCETSLSEAATEQARISAVAHACSSCAEQIHIDIYKMQACKKQREKTSLHTGLKLHVLILCEGVCVSCTGLRVKAMTQGL